MENQDHPQNNVFSHLDSVRMADTPRVENPPVQVLVLKPLRKSIYYGILLYLLQTRRKSLPPEKVFWIIHYSKRLSETELLKAAKFSEQLLTDEKTLRRTRKEIERIYPRIPFARIVPVPELRRIGTGYHDKGALRPRHHPRLEGERVFWSQDLKWMLPPTVETEGKWLTANEVQSLVGEDFLSLMLHQTLVNKIRETLN